MRLLIVSNRLPVTVLDESSLQVQESVGGLASGLKAYLDSIKATSECNYIWVGWPGTTIKGRMKEQLSSRLMSEHNAQPVFLSEKAMEKFYHGFCTRTIWPLFHYFPSYTVYDEDYWTNYKLVNETFCSEIVKMLRPGDVVWIHDFHLMLLPKLLREKSPETPIGFFLHIPFPSFELFRLLPSSWRREILEGLLGADLIGFHTHDYTMYFLRCVLRILGYEHTMGGIMVGDRLAKADTFPMGVDFNKFHEAAESPEVARRKEGMKRDFAGRKVVLSLDRLDYTKGIVNRLRGYDAFLERNPQWREKVTLVAAVVPSRVKVEHYQQMKKQIDELVGRINGKHGKVNWTPILYSYRFLPFEQLIALYNISDVALITPLRDGMNLIAKEYISAKTDGKGVLILSEMAGASKALGEALIINPSNVDDIADALKKALEMPEEEQVRRNKILRARLESYDVVRWADDFLQALLTVNEDQKRLSTRALGLLARENLKDAYRSAEKRLLLLDYDGTLVPFHEDPQSAKPGERLLKLLRKLSEDPRNEVVLISGRDRDTLQKWFGDLGIGLVAEHGVWIRRGKEVWMMPKPLSADWMPEILPLMKRYTNRLPGSFVENKEYSLVWHYRAADPDVATVKARELVDDLLNFTRNTELEVLSGNKVVEIRNSGANKSNAALWWTSKDDFDYLMAIGDDSTDEDMFVVLPQTAYSFKVGDGKSKARFKLKDNDEVLRLLEELSTICSWSQFAL
jgi:trehalose 6-phosphate synthase/phosphatase